MLAKRIIPCLDCDLSIPTGRVVKGIKFKNLVYAGRPELLAEKYYKKGADEIVFLDITASVNNRRTMTDVIKKTCKNTFIPLSIGGGIKNLDDIKKVLRAGADKVTINTAAVQNPELIKEACEKFGSQCVVVSIDAKKVKGEYKVHVYGGRKATNLNVLSWAKKVEELGAGEILLTSMDRDGTRKGFDIKLTKRVAESVNIPVIASGGGGSIDDFVNVFNKGKADAALAASIFHFNLLSITELKEGLKKEGVNVRL